MSDTPFTLLQELRTQPSDQAWQRLVEVYDTLLRTWLGDQGSDQDDLVQEILLVLMKKLPEFEHSGQPGAFRSWLKAIMTNCIRRSWRSERQKPLATGDSEFLQKLQQLEDPTSDLSRDWDQQHDRIVMQRLLNLIRSDVEQVVWMAFYRHGIEGVPARDVAEELGMTANYVYVAKSRVLKKLRTLAAGLVDSIDDKMGD